MKVRTCVVSEGLRAGQRLSALANHLGEYLSDHGAVFILLSSAEVGEYDQHLDELGCVSGYFERLGVRVAAFVLRGNGGHRSSGRWLSPTIIALDRAGRLVYRQRLERGSMIDLVDLIENVGDIADGD
jgi:hypothetical protein